MKKPVDDSSPALAHSQLGFNMRAMNATTTPAPTLRRLLPWVCFGLLALAQWPAMADGETGQPQMKLPRTQLSAGMHLIDAQVAQTPEQRQIGLMFRREMPQQEGMIFVFEQPATQCFWMRNTVLPLSAAFVGDDGRIANLADMKPMTETSHCSTQPVRYVLEMNLGWFAKRGIKAGDQLGGALFQARK
jgi:uncharacterized membrane protein (UPF0127 family)